MQTRLLLLLNEKYFVFNKYQLVLPCPIYCTIEGTKLLQNMPSAIEISALGLNFRNNDQTSAHVSKILIDVHTA